MSTYQKIQKISPKFWPRYSFTVENLNSNPLLKKLMDENSACHNFKDRSEHFRYVSDEIVKKNPIDYLEFGVYKGDSIREWIGLNQDAGSMFFGFDTFTGLPDDWTYTVKKGEFDLGGDPPTINDRRVILVKGLFQDTLRPFLKDYVRRYRMVIHLDADLFSSTLYVLSQLDYLLNEGDILMFDEFSSITGEFKAFSVYKEAFKRELRMVSRVQYDGWLSNQVAFLFDK